MIELFETFQRWLVTPPSYGTYDREIAAVFLVENGEDYRIRLLEPLSYTGPDGETTTVPRGEIVDGASIPAFAWPFVGAPLSGDFRRASVIHDWGCRQQTEPSWVVHSRFYYAMRADDVGRFRAFLMYLCVRWFGPQFDGLVRETSTHA
jgi:hypothetical protein